MGKRRALKHLYEQNKAVVGSSRMSVTSESLNLLLSSKVARSTMNKS